ncbi:carbohydrate ABC transporter permease [Paenibacillus sp. N3.4]|uniref:carbohydrate ABC transporter permease n=1 Tax=Paenibacillus sp. N3.4 TaxID=2603222 RepID=UPI0011C83253|nr:carbohydrate ABC transporter permease [Paenibacillus sp. N3.4]TXK85123.1 carbohydrate ABC transporter permease [Paenibacillus sp. N3.4]
MRDKAGGWLIDTILYIGGIIMLMPFIWMIATSLKSSREAMLLTWLPTHLEWSNYVTVWNAIPFLRFLANSVFIVVTSTLGGMLITTLAAFAFSRLQFYGKKILFALMIGTMMVPEELLLIPNYMTISHLGWIDHYEALIIPWMTNAFSVFLLVQHFSSVPSEYYHAARVDGIRPFFYLWRIMVPLTTPILTTLLIMKTIACWNAYLWPILVTNRVEMRTIQAGMLAFSTDTGTSYELLMAAATLTVLPMIVLYIWLQKHIIQGISQVGQSKN